MKILIVDDIEDNLILQKSILTSQGYTVETADNGVNALKAAARFCPDMIISDILMPEMDGFDLCRAVKADNYLKDIPFVFYSASYTATRDRELATALGAVRHIEKPIEPEEFLKIIENVFKECKGGKLVVPERSKLDDHKLEQMHEKILVNKLSEKVNELQKEMDIRRQAERHLNAQYFVTQVLVESVTIKEASPKILQAVCMALEWDLGEIYVYDQQSCVLRCSEIWHIPSIEVPKYKKITRETTFSRDTGLPGRVFSSAQPVWISDVVQDDNFPRASVAAQEGLHGAFGFPILSGSEVLGTISFFSREIRRPDRDLLNMLSAIGSQIGLFIKRKQAEEKIRKLSQAIEYSSATIVITDTEGNIEYINPIFTELTGYSLEEAIGKNPRILKSGKIPPDAYKELWETITSGNEWKGEFCNRKKNGELYWESASISPVKNEEGTITNFIAVKEDITIRKHAEESAKQSLEQLRATVDGVITALALTVEQRDPYTAGHQQRVSSLACKIAEEMGFTEDQTEGVRMAGIVHDIGKMHIPAEILSRPGKLTDDEFNIVRTHAQVGYDILKGIEFPWPVADIVRQHHEKIDGSGYPLGLSDGDILMEARIMCVADVVEAMASHRPYRPALGMDKALEEISSGKEVCYDSEVVNACLKIVTEKGFKFDDV